MLPMLSKEMITESCIMVLEIQTIHGLKVLIQRTLEDIE